MKNYMYIIVFILINIVLCLIYYKNIFTIEPFKPCDFKHGVLSDNQLTDLNDLLKTLINFFNSEKISYFGHSGTAIGAMRSGGLLPFDDDIDFGIIKTDEDINKIKSYKNKEYYFQPRWFGYKFKKKNSKLFIDIMTFSLDKTETKYEMLGWNWNYIKKTELYPLQLHTYNEMDIPFPNKCIEYLNRSFKNWDTTIKINCGHEAEIGNSKKCIYDTMGIPSEFNVNDYDKKYLCYTKF